MYFFRSSPFSQQLYVKASTPQSEEVAAGIPGNPEGVTKKQVEVKAEQEAD